MKSRLHLLGWAFAGSIVLLALVGVVFHVQPSHPLIEQFVLEAKNAELVATMRRALVAATAAEKSAVLAIDDESSAAFAAQARAAASEVETARVQLGQALQVIGSPKEHQALERFGSAFAEFQRVDRELLALAVRNSNLKATALTFGAGAATVRSVDNALQGIIDQSKAMNGDTAKRAMFVAARAQAGALRIQVLLPPHIAEASAGRMDQLEAQMDEQDRGVRAALDELRLLLPAKDPAFSTAVAAYTQLTELKTKILALSRENTNVRSLDISLHEKRKITIACEEALSALEEAIDDARTLGAGRSAVRARR